MHLPGLELREGVPPDLRAIVVMPTLLTSVSTIQEQIERLEVHHLSNSDDNFTFALLTDWGDSAAEHAACWPGFKITFHYRSSRYEISVEIRCWRATEPGYNPTRALLLFVVGRPVSAITNGCSESRHRRRSKYSIMVSF